MRQQINRKSTPGVSSGRVQKKNNPEWTANYYTTSPPSLVIDRQRPGQGYRHVLMQRDVERFIRLLPDWAELSRGLRAIVLAPGERGTAGWHTPGVVGVCAWEVDLWIDYAVGHYEDHQAIFERLGVRSHKIENGVMCEFTEDQARAYQLLHILLHELGHHHDRMTTKSKVRAARGEPYAESYALAYEARIWDRYQEEFGW